MGRQTRRADIQGLRAVAVAAVVLYHAGVPFLAGGYVGVDVFFVISGYLITGHLMREYAESGRLSLFTFYGRRLRRLMPMAILVIAATLVASKVWLAPLLLPAISRDGIASSVALSNIWFAFTGTDYLAHGSLSPFQHYWSLAVEEQFYLVWPLMIILLFHAFRNRRSIGISLIGLTAASFVASIWLTSVSQPWAFFGLPTRAWELGAGALLAIGPIAGRTPRPWLSRTLGWGGLALIAGSVFAFSSTTTFPGWSAALPVIGSAGVLVGGTSKQTYSVASLLEKRPLRFLGDISYSLYLWHWPILVIPALAIGSNLSPFVVGVLLILAVLLASVSYVHVEQRFQRPWHQRVKGGTYSLAIAFTGLVVGLSLLVGILPNLNSGTPSHEPSETELMMAPSIPTTVPSNLDPALKDVESSLPPIYGDGCHAGVPETTSPECLYGATSSSKKIVLFGDSHAAQWFSPLRAYAEKRGMALVSLTKSACPSVEIPVAAASLGREYSECDLWRDHAIDRIRDLDPTLVVMANATAGYRSLTLTSASFESQWESGLRATIEDLPDSAKVVVLGDTPRWTISPNVCVSANLQTVQACSLSRNDLVDDSLLSMEEATVHLAGAKFIKTDDWLCNARCSPLLWNKLVYRDSNHITDSMARALTGRLAAGLG